MTNPCLVSTQFAQMLFGSIEHYEQAYVQFIKMELAKQQLSSKSTCFSAGAQCITQQDLTPLDRDPRLHADAQISMLLSDVQCMKDARALRRSSFCSEDLTSVDFLCHHRYLHFVHGGKGVDNWDDSLERVHYILFQFPVSSLCSIRTQAVAGIAGLTSTVSVVDHNSTDGFEDVTLSDVRLSEAMTDYELSTRINFFNIVIKVIDTNVARQVNKSRVLSHILNTRGVIKDLGLVIGSFLTSSKLQTQVYTDKGKRKELPAPDAQDDTDKNTDNQPHAKYQRTE